MPVPLLVCGGVLLTRVIVFAGVVVFVALLAPKLAPSLIAGIVETAATPEASPQAPEPRERELARQVALDADSRGHFVTTARINGQKVAVLVDTGATMVAISAETARRLGVYPAKSAFTARVNTANGVAAVAPVKLREVSVGDVTLRNVDAAVSADDRLDVNLLGMSFLGRLSSFEVREGELILTQ